MTVLRLYSQLPPLKGGMEKHIYNLSIFQEKQYHWNVYNMYNSGNDINIHSQKICKYIDLSKIGITTLEMFLFYFCIVFNLFFKNKQFDIIHIHGDWSSLLFIKFLKKLTNAKIVTLSIHGQFSDKFTHQKLLPRLIQNIDLIFSTGYDTAKELEKLSGKKVVIQPSGINEIFFKIFNKSFNNDKFTIVTVANLFAKKNIELILEIAKELENFRFIIVGDGNHRNILENKLKKDNILNVKLVGFKIPKEVREFYINSDVYLLTSLAEGTPTSALEAMACGLPIVSSNAGGLGNIVKENKNGFIIDNFDKSKYIEKIKLLKNSTELRKVIFNNNILLSKQYKWDNVAKNITDIMENTFNE